MSVKFINASKATLARAIKKQAATVPSTVKVYPNFVNQKGKISTGLIAKQIVQEFPDAFASRGSVAKAAKRSILNAFKLPEATTAKDFAKFIGEDAQKSVLVKDIYSKYLEVSRGTTTMQKKIAAELWEHLQRLTATR